MTFPNLIVSAACVAWLTVHQPSGGEFGLAGGSPPRGIKLPPAIDSRGVVSGNGNDPGAFDVPLFRHPAFQSCGVTSVGRSDGDQFLAWLSWRESRNRDDVRGRHGELGRYQIRPIAWREVQRVTGWRDRHTADRATQERYARALVGILRARYVARHGTEPTQKQLWRYWNTGRC